MEINNGMSNSNITPSNNYAINNNRDRLRRLRIEADYYGLHQCMIIDVVTIGEKVVFEANMGWARVACCGWMSFARCLSYKIHG